MPKKNFFIKSIESIEWRIAVKTGIAASISLFLGLGFSQLLQRPDTLVSGLWCVMASIVVLQAHLGGTYKAAWIRFLGVLVGSIMGGFFTVQFGSGALSLGLSICGTILLCSLIGIKDSVRIASLSVAVVMILWGIRPSISPWTFALFRFLDSCLGILVAVVVAHVFWPEKAATNLQKNITKSLLSMSKLYRLATDLDESDKSIYASQELELEIDDLMQKNQDFHEVSKLELLTRFDNPEELAILVSQLDSIFKSIVALKNVPKVTLAKVFDDALGNQVTDVVDKSDLAFQLLAKSVENEQASVNFDDLQLSLDKLNEEQIRFRATRATRKFNLEDVESFFVFFYNLRSIGDSLIKMHQNLQTLF